MIVALYTYSYLLT